MPPLPTLVHCPRHRNTPPPPSLPHRPLSAAQGCSQDSRSVDTRAPQRCPANILECPQAAVDITAATAGQDSETTTSLSNKTTMSQLHGTYCALRPLRLLTQVPSSAASPALFTLRAWRSAPPQRTGLSPTAWDLEPPTGPAGLRGLGEQRQCQSHLRGAPGASRIWPQWVTVLERGPAETGALGLATS